MFRLKLFWLLFIIQYGKYVCQDYESNYYFTTEQTDAPDFKNLSVNNYNNNVTYVSTKNLSGNIEIGSLKILTTTEINVNDNPENTNLTDVHESKDLTNGSSTSGDYVAAIDDEQVNFPITTITPTTTLERLEIITAIPIHLSEVRTEINVIENINGKQIIQKLEPVNEDESKELEDISSILTIDNDFLSTVTEDAKSILSQENFEDIITGDLFDSSDEAAISLPKIDELPKFVMEEINSELDKVDVVSENKGDKNEGLKIVIFDSSSEEGIKKESPPATTITSSEEMGSNLFIVEKVVPLAEHTMAPFIKEIIEEIQNNYKNEETTTQIQIDLNDFEVPVESTSFTVEELTTESSFTTIKIGGSKRENKSQDLIAAASDIYENQNVSEGIETTSAGNYIYDSEIFETNETLKNIENQQLLNLETTESLIVNENVTNSEFQESTFEITDTVLNKAILETKSNNSKIVDTLNRENLEEFETTTNSVILLQTTTDNSLNNLELILEMEKINSTTSEDSLKVFEKSAQPKINSMITLRTEETTANYPEVENSTIPNFETTETVTSSSEITLETEETKDSLMTNTENIDETDMYSTTEIILNDSTIRFSRNTIANEEKTSTETYWIMDVGTTSTISENMYTPSYAESEIKIFYETTTNLNSLAEPKEEHSTKQLEKSARLQTMSQDQENYVESILPVEHKTFVLNDSSKFKEATTETTLNLTDSNISNFFHDFTKLVQNGTESLVSSTFSEDSYDAENSTQSTILTKPEIENDFNTKFEESQDDEPVITAIIFNKVTQFSVVITEKESNYYIPSDACVSVDRDPPFIAITWKSSKEHMHNTLIFNLTGAIDVFVINGVQLNITKANDIMVLEKDVIILPPENSIVDKPITITMDDNTNISISNIEFLKLYNDANIRELQINAYQQHRKMQTFEIVLLIILLVSVLAIGCFVIIKRHRNEVEIKSVTAIEITA